MSRWLDPVRSALDRLAEPVTFFFRDDDAGWNDDRLIGLLDLFADYDLPLDLAVIPQALTAELARELCERAEKQPERIGLHQHGFAHTNHEAQGRKCEFGEARPIAIQERDIQSGKRMLFELLGPAVQPIFTPPWNRCAAQTGDCLVRLEFRALSRDRSAAPLKISGLAELPVSVDWFAKRKGRRLTPDQLALLIVDAMKDAQPVGIMFHHAVMDDDERNAAAELLALLEEHDRAECRLMRSLIETQVQSHHSQ